MDIEKIVLETAAPNDCAEIGRLMAGVYANLEGFPSRVQQPEYYKLFDNLEQLISNPEIEIIVAKSSHCGLQGGIIYVGDMQYYGSGGTATSIANASGIRLLAVTQNSRGKGVGRTLTEACINRARSSQRSQVVLHTTDFMKIAWGMYQAMGFVRSPDLDFMQEQLSVFGFRLNL